MTAPPTTEEPTMTNARPTMHTDADRVRVTNWSFGADETTGFHTHELDYLVVPITSATFEVVDVDGATRTMEQQAGVPYLGTAGTAHEVINRSGAAASFVEIELKR
jgi:hypothetical protein